MKKLSPCFLNLFLTTPIFEAHTGRRFDREASISGWTVVRRWCLGEIAADCPGVVFGVVFGDLETAIYLVIVAGIVADSKVLIRLRIVN
jgi:hypothetical protein